MDESQVNECPYHIKKDDETADVDNAPLPPLINKGLRQLSSTIQFYQDPIEFFKNCIKKHGNTFRIKMLNQEFYSINGDEALELLSNHRSKTLSAGSVWDELLAQWQAKQTIINTDGPIHLRMRKHLKKMTNKDSLNQLHPMLTEVIKQQLKQLPLQRSIKPAFFNRQLICHLIHSVFNKSASNLDNKFIKDVLTWHKYAWRMFVSKTLPKVFKYSPIYKRKNKIVWNYIENIKQERAHRPKDDVFSTILNIAKEEPDLFTCDGDINFVFIQTLVASIDNIGNTLTYLMYELGANPHSHRLICQCIDELVAKHHGQIPPAEVIKDEQPLLMGLCLETMRLHPTAPFTNRRVDKSFVFNGYHYPKGAELIIFTGANHFNENIFPSPYQFDFKRAQQSKNAYLQKNAFLPFGLGAHMCTAVGFSELLLLSLITTILYYLDFSAVKPNKVYKTRFVEPILRLDPRFKIKINGFRHSL